MNLFISDNDVLYGFQKKIIIHNARGFVDIGCLKFAQAFWVSSSNFRFEVGGRFLIEIFIKS